MSEQQQMALDAARYRHLRDYFAINSDNDKDEFVKLSQLTGKEFDRAIDKSIVEQRA